MCDYVVYIVLFHGCVAVVVHVSFSWIGSKNAGLNPGK